MFLGYHYITLQARSTRSTYGEAVEDVGLFPSGDEAGAEGLLCRVEADLARMSCAWKRLVERSGCGWEMMGTSSGDWDINGNINLNIVRFLEVWDK